MTITKLDVATTQLDYSTTQGLDHLGSMLRTFQTAAKEMEYYIQQYCSDTKGRSREDCLNSAMAYCVNNVMQNLPIAAMARAQAEIAVAKAQIKMLSE